MPEIIRALSDHEVETYAPMRELLKRGRNQVYETVGEYLNSLYEIDKNWVEEGCFLVQLDNEQLVAFPYGVRRQVEGNPTKSSFIAATALADIVFFWHDYDYGNAGQRRSDQN